MNSALTVDKFMDDNGLLCPFNRLSYKGCMRRLPNRIVTLINSDTFDDRQRLFFILCERLARTKPRSGDARCMIRGRLLKDIESMIKPSTVVDDYGRQERGTRVTGRIQLPEALESDNGTLRLCDAKTPTSEILSYVFGPDCQGKYVKLHQRRLDFMESMLAPDALFIYFRQGKRHGGVVYFVDTRMAVEDPEEAEAVRPVPPSKTVMYRVVAIDYANCGFYLKSGKPRYVGTVKYWKYGSEEWHERNPRWARSSRGFLMLTGLTWGILTTTEWTGSRKREINKYGITERINYRDGTFSPYFLCYMRVKQSVRPGSYGA